MSGRARLLFLPPLFPVRLAPRHFPPQLTGIFPPARGRCSTNLISRMSSSVSPPPELAITLPGGDRVPIVVAPGLTDADLRNAVGSSLFKQWLENMQSERGLLTCGNMCLRQVHIQGVDMFGSRVGFLKFKADIVDRETGTKVRVPVGKFLLELPAGMIDDERGDIVGTAVREVEEETGICLKIEDMVNLTAFLDPATGCKVFPSPGGSDEEISLFLYKGYVEEETIHSLHGRELGLREHGELIKVHVVPYEKLWRATADSKALIAIALYEMANRDGLLPAT